MYYRAQNLMEAKELFIRTGFPIIVQDSVYYQGKLYSQEEFNKLRTWVN